MQLRSAQYSEHVSGDIKDRVPHWYIGRLLQGDLKGGRIRLQESDRTRARKYFFKAMIEDAGRYDNALNQAARMLLQRRYADAIEYPDRVREVGSRQLCFRAVGEAAGAQREQALFQQFKPEESAQAITARPRFFSPKNSNARRPIHDRESVPLEAPPHNPKILMTAAGGSR